MNGRSFAIPGVAVLAPVLWPLFLPARAMAIPTKPGLKLLEKDS
jgi:hypothetical protein